MNNTPVSHPASHSSAAALLESDELDLLVEQLREAYPSATDRLLNQAIAESQKEIGDSSDRELLLRFVRERITA